VGGFLSLSLSAYVESESYLVHGAQVPSQQALLQLVVSAHQLHNSIALMKKLYIVMQVILIENIFSFEKIVICT